MRVLVCISAALAVAATIFAATAGASPGPTPVVTGCPAGFSLFPITTFPYQVPRQLDSPANAGNGDGWVCAHAVPDAVRDASCAAGRGGCLLVELNLPLYDFSEDDSPAQGVTDLVG